MGWPVGADLGSPGRIREAPEVPGPRRQRERGLQSARVPSLQQTAGNFDAVVYGVGRTHPARVYRLAASAGSATVSPTM